MNKSDMLECLINYYTDGNKTKFASRLGIKPQTINSWATRGTFDIELIYSKCDGVSAEWLLSNGQGEMLKSENTTTAHVHDIESSNVAVGNNASISADNKLLQERVTMLEKLLDEKERTIKILLKKQ